MATYRLLVVDHAVEMGGAEIILLDLLDRLDTGLFEAALASPAEGPLTRKVREKGLPVFLGHPSPNLLRIKRDSMGDSKTAMLTYPLDLLVSAVRLARLIRRERFDLVLTHSAKADIYGSLAGWLARRPVVWRLHDIVDREAFSRLNVWLMRTFARNFSRRVMAISGAVRGALMAMGVGEDKVVVIHNGVRREGAGGTAKRKQMRAGLGIGEDEAVVGFVGRLVAWKGPDYFIKAAALVARELPPARFVVAGDAIYGEHAYAEGLRSLSSSLGLGEKLVFTGFVEDIDDVMCGLDLLVHTSVLPEPFGLVIAEAMMRGIPVVAAEGGGVREIVEDGVTGLVVPPRREAELARAILEVLGDRARAREMGEAARERARQLFDIETMTRRIEGELLDVLRG